VHWHLERQHRVVLVTGTLAPLARAIARHLPCGVQARATELEIRGRRLTGRISRKHLSFEEKARVIREEAAECNVDLSQSFAYGNEMSDVSMLETVGHPAVVNASWGLGREARKRGWTVYKWNDSRETEDDQDMLLSLPRRLDEYVRASRVPRNGAGEHCATPRGHTSSVSGRFITSFR
jgi:phosphoserine phosphatase